MQTERKYIIICFNTASGRCCYFITFVFPSFQSGTRDVRASLSLCSSAASHPSSHIASGRYCCNNGYIYLVIIEKEVSIPQAVGTVTPSFSFSLPFGQGLEMCGPHRRFTPLLPRTLRRIPQAVSTVNSSPLFSLPFGQGLEMCGPHRRFAPLLPRTLRRIPQAVRSAVAISGSRKPVFMRFQKLVLENLKP